MTDLTNRPTIPESLVSSRLLMLQSKRLILATLERRWRNRPLESMRARVESMRTETEDAYEHYCLSLLKWGSAESQQYWPVAYGRLIETAEKLSRKLRGVSHELPASDQYQLATEVEMLDALVERWRKSIKGSMIAVA